MILAIKDNFALLRLLHIFWNTFEENNISILELRTDMQSKLKSSLAIKGVLNNKNEILCLCWWIWAAVLFLLSATKFLSTLNLRTSLWLTRTPALPVELLPAWPPDLSPLCRLSLWCCELAMMTRVSLFSDGWE